MVAKFAAKRAALFEQINNAKLSDRGAHGCVV